MRFAMVVLGWMLTLSAVAQIARPVRFEGQPLIYTNEGEITGCGVRLVGVEQTPGKPFLLLDTSLQIDSRMFGVLAKFTARYGVMKGEEVSIKSTAIVERGWYRIDGMSPTKPKDGKYIPTKEPVGGVFYLTSTTQDMRMLSAMIEGETIEMGTKFKGESGEVIRFGKIIMSEPERMRATSCIATLSKAFEAKLQNVENEAK